MPSTTFIEAGTDATQDLTFWTGTTLTGTGAVASSTAQQFTGPRSINCTNGGTAASNAFLYKSAVCADAGRRISFRVRLANLPSSGTPGWSAVDDATGLNIAAIGTTAAGLFNLGIQGPGNFTGVTTLVTNKWYRIVLSYTITNTTTFRFTAYVDGLLQVTVTTGTLTRTGSDRFRVAITSSGSQYSANSNVYFDDIYIDDGSDYTDPGDIRVTNKRSFANGTTNGFTTQIGSGGSSYGTGHAPQVNEQPLSITNGWSMIGAGSAVTEEYTIEDKITGDVNISLTTIVSVFGWVYAKSLASETANIVVDGTSTNIALTSTATLFSLISATPTVFPALAGTDIGIITATDLTTVSLYECGILVAFIMLALEDYVEPLVDFVEEDWEATTY